MDSALLLDMQIAYRTAELFGDGLKENYNLRWSTKNLEKNYNDRKYGKLTIKMEKKTI